MTFREALAKGCGGWVESVAAAAFPTASSKAGVSDLARYIGVNPCKGSRAFAIVEAVALNGGAESIIEWAAQYTDRSAEVDVSREELEEMLERGKEMLERMPH